MSDESASSPVQQVRWVGQNVVVDAVGDIDLNSSSLFQQELLLLMDKTPRRIVINLAGVPYMDSSGVASLVKLLSRTRKSESSLYLVRLNDRVRSVFEITRLDTVFNICGTEEEALA